MEIKMNRCQEYDQSFREANLFSRVFFRFATGMIRNVKANGCHMKDEHMLDLNQVDNETQLQLQLFEEYFEHFENQFTVNGLYPDYFQVLKKSLLQTYKRTIIWIIVLGLFTDVIIFFYSFFIRFVIIYIEDEDASVSEGVYLSVIFIIALIIGNFLRIYKQMLSYKLILYLRKTFTLTLYKKLGKLQLDQFSDGSQGKLLTLVSSDLLSAERILINFDSFFIALFSNLLLFGLLTYLIGWQYAMINLSFFILQFSCSFGTQGKIVSLKSRHSKITDELVNLTANLINGVKTLKCYGWELHYLEKISFLKTTLQRVLMLMNMLVQASQIVYTYLGLVSSLIIFLVMWAKGDNFELSKTVSLFSLINMIFINSNSRAYSGMVGMMLYKSALVRGSTLLKLKDHNTTSVNQCPKPEEKVQISLTKAFFNWKANNGENDLNPQQEFELKVYDDEQKSSLQGIDLKLEKGMLVVIGKTGSGKTTFLHSLMNETYLVKGEMQVTGRIAYVEQEPFILSTTVKENILFGEEFDEDRFQEAIKVCQLERDIQIMPNGEHTYIGEKGLNISGGQKARISLARAVYSNADIFLLDDPLSAVDTHVAHEIFHTCISKHLRDKIVVLVTHQLQLIKECQQILVLEEGTQNIMGSYEDIKLFEENLLDQISISQVNEGPLNTTQGEFNSFDINERTSIVGQIQKDAVLITERIMTGQQAEEEIILKDTILEGPKKDYCLIQNEEEDGKIGPRVFLDYLGARCGIIGIIILAFTYLVAAVIHLAPSFILTQWSEQTFEEQQEKTYPTAFGLSIALFLIASCIRALVNNNIIVGATTNLYKIISYQIIRAKTLFFESNPSGRIITRFSKDTIIMETTVPMLFLMSFQGILRTCSVVISVIVVNPYLLIPFALCFTIFLLYFFYVIEVVSECQRLDSVHRGPLHQNMIQLMNGLVTFRAYRKIDFYRDDFIRHLENSANATFSNICSDRWMSNRLEISSIAFGAFTVVACMVFKTRIDSELLAYSLQSVIEAIAMIGIFLRLFIELVNNMMSAKRILSYTKLDLEDELIKPKDSSEELKDWPSQANVDFKNVCMRYRDFLDLSMKEVTFSAGQGMKVGIVGRTGAGKSSILHVLFRLTEVEDNGSIEIDGVNISEIGLHKLRKNIAFIPQNPFLMQGTIRENLDPFDEYDDERIIEVLENVQLWSFIVRMENGLMTELKDSNSVFSVGQKQLICLARAMLIQAKILVLDEATANVDLETDNLIQMQLRENFVGCTLLIIAHRLQTIIDSDRVLVMDQGKSVEFDHPFKLLALDENDTQITSSSVFAGMILNNSSEVSQEMFETAKQRFMENQQVGE